MSRWTTLARWRLSGRRLFGKPNDLYRSGNAGRSGELPVVVSLVLEAVLHEEMQIVSLIEHLATDACVVAAEESNFAVLLGHKPLIHSRDLDVDVFFRKVEIRGEILQRLTVVGVLDGERCWLVLPLDVIEVEEPGELPLALVGEFDAVCR